ncbi:MAG: two-component system sensor histidine kinase PhoQ [Oleiphilaceae bacterium]|jgi:two-component system sensor histidine kinase PhoQ
MTGLSREKKTILPLSTNSINNRLLIASLILLPLFCGILGFSLDKAFSESLKSNEKAQLLLQAYALIASAELNNNELWLPEQLTEDKLNQVSSGLFAVIYSDKDGKAVWISPSGKNSSITQNWPPEALPSGDQLFTELDHHDEKLFSFQYSVTWETSDKENLTFQFGIFNNQQTFNEQVLTYQRSLWGWLGAIAISIIILQTLILKWGLRPIRIVAEDLRSVQDGQTTQLKGHYPIELIEMTSSINALLATEAEQRTRYKDSLSNLAHSLKTPLAIMQGSLYELRNSDFEENNSRDINKSSARKELSEQIKRIDQIISYQLKRSVVAPNNPFSTMINVRHQCERVITALKKVYVENHTFVELEVEKNIFFRGDENDLVEVLGNLLDNAFKYGNEHILIRAKQIREHNLNLAIEDNGSGISEELKNKVLERGERADTSQQGQGIGLATVTDIVSHYSGSLKLENSKLGGLAVIIEF